MVPRAQLVFMVVSMCAAGSLYGQSLISPRPIALGAYDAIVNDTRGFPANPAGLVGIRDWEFTASTYTATTLPEGGFVFHGLTFGKRFWGTEAAGFQYSPASAVRFAIPTSISIGPSNTPVSNDREIAYYEPFSLGLAHSFGRGLSVGAVGRYRREHVVDTQYEIVIQDTVAYPLRSTKDYEARYWNLDLGGLYVLSDRVTASVLGRNLVAGIGSELPEELASLRLPTAPFLEAGLVARPWEWMLVSAQVTSDAAGALGAEWLPGGGFAIRAGAYMDKSESPFVYGLGAGLGWSYEFLEIDAGYLHFLDQSGRTGSTDVRSFDPADIINIDLNPYSSDRLAVSVKAIFGKTRTSAAKIEGVTLTSQVYPAYAQVYAYRPLGSATIRNISPDPIEARVSVYAERFMDSPTECRPVAIMPDQAVEIPLTAVFNEQVLKVTDVTVKELTVTVRTSAAQEYEHRYQARLVVQGKNAWDGDVLTLRYFVTPDDPDIIRFTRDVLLQKDDSAAVSESRLEPFMNARTIVDAFSGKLTYVADPKLSADRVQYPSETLRMRSGDCDDMSVCFASLLSSMGISTAFVDVVPPDRPDSSHIYLLFDTGLGPQFGAAVSGNPKRYVIRKGPSGRESIWIPLETTVVAQGFEVAWTQGAENYFHDVEVELGLVRGWVRVVDIN